ncbi:MAG: acyl-CoA dehydrogenase [Betaproteobacteria bacterium]
MDFALSEEQQAIQQLARRYAREQVAIGYQARDAGHTPGAGVPAAMLKEMAGLGLTAITISEEYGGQGLDGLTAGLVTDELAYADFNVGGFVIMNALIGHIVEQHAHPDVAMEWLPRLAAGEALAALGLTEPRGGSDAANLNLRADKSGSDYILRGEKTSITLADQADFATVFARTGRPEDGARGVSAFLVPLKQAGIRTTRFDDVGNRMNGRGSIFFDDVRLPAEYRLGAEGKGFTQVMQGFDFSRVLLGIQCLGAAQASLDEAWEYTKERRAFGAPIAQYQGVTFPLAEAETLITAARWLCYRALWLRDRGLPHTAEAAMCKWWPPKLAYDIIHQCLLSFGHYGYTKDLPHQQRMRDVLGIQIGDGTAQIMKLIIARERVGRVAVQYDQGATKRPLAG